MLGVLQYFALLLALICIIDGNTNDQSLYANAYTIDQGNAARNLQDTCDRKW